MLSVLETHCPMRPATTAVNNTYRVYKYKDDQYIVGAFHLCGQIKLGKAY